MLNLEWIKHTGDSFIELATVAFEPMTTLRSHISALYTQAISDFPLKTETQGKPFNWGELFWILDRVQANPYVADHETGKLQKIGLDTKLEFQAMIHLNHQSKR